jgi:hypothetical protein
MPAQKPLFFRGQQPIMGQVAVEDSVPSIRERLISQPFPPPSFEKSSQWTVSPIEAYSAR